MHFTAATILAFASSAVLASPFQRRQESVTGSAAVSSEGATTSTAVSAVTGTETTGTAIESATSALGSAVSGAATATGSSAPAATATSEANATSPEAFAFGCPDGYSLTYAVGVAPFPDVDIEEAYSALSEWGTAIPPPIESVDSEGEGEGAMRTWSLTLGETNLTVMEELIRVNETENEFLEQEWNLTQPIEVSPALTISNYSNVLTLYTNSTSNETTVQLFSNFCASEQQTALDLMSQLVTAYLTGLGPLFSNSTMMGGNETESTTTAAAGAATTTGAESTAAESTAAESTAAESTAAESSAESSASGTTSAPESSATSSGSGIVNSVTGGAASAAGSLTSAPAAAASSALGGVTSGLGGIIPTRRV